MTIAACIDSSMILIGCASTLARLVSHHVQPATAGSKHFPAEAHQLIVAEARQACRASRRR